MEPVPSNGSRSGLTRGEAGQADLRVLGALLVLGVYGVAGLVQVFGDLGRALVGILVYTGFALVWRALVRRAQAEQRGRLVAGLVLDHLIFAAGVAYAGSQFAPIMWLPTFVGVGYGLRYGLGLAQASSAIGVTFVVVAMAVTPFWREVPEAAAAIVLLIALVPSYAAALSERLQRDRRDAEQRAATLEIANRTDPLTGICNRLGFAAVLRRFVEDSRELGTKGAVYYLDLDGFKAVNDRAGHAVGDRILVDVAQRLTACVRSSDVVARLGGDEFAIVARGIGTTHDAHRLAAKLLAAVGEVKVAGQEALAIGASIGACIVPDGTRRDHQDVLQQADELMLEVKRSAKGSFRIVG